MFCMAEHVPNPTTISVNNHCNGQSHVMAWPQKVTTWYAVIFYT